MTKHSRIPLFIAAILISIAGYSQDDNASVANDAIRLIWKVDKGETISYQTVMNNISEPKFELYADRIFGKSVDSLGMEVLDFSKEYFEKMRGIEESTNYVTKLTNSSDFSDVIDIEMVTVKDPSAKKTNDDVAELARLLMDGTVLRGSVCNTGQLHSFWVKSDQKNLLSMLFELPNKPLKKGDQWTLKNVNFIANDHNFVSKEAQQNNVVTLTDIKIIDGETIAVIDYDLYEYVSGDFNVPAIMGNEKSVEPTMMKFMYKAQAEFSIEKGKWISYNGIMTVDTSGYLTTTQRKKFALIEI